MSQVKLFDINEVEWKDWSAGMRTCVFKPTERGTMQYWEIQPGAGAEPHSHEAEQLTYVQEGYLEVTIDGKTYELTPGCYCLIPSEAEHSTLNVGMTRCVNIDIFMPQRDDREESPRILDRGHNWER